MYRSYKIRLLPTKEQEEIMFKYADGYRFTWNWGLSYQMKLHENDKPILSYAKLRKEYTKYTNTDNGKWIRNLPLKYMYEALRDLEKAFTWFFKNAQKQNPGFSKKVLIKCAKENRKPTTYEMYGHPKFKSKKDAKVSFYCSAENTYFKSNNMIYLQKLGNIKFSTNYILPSGFKYEQKGKIHDPRVVYEHGKWTMNVVLECDNQTPQLNDYVIGIDLGLRVLAVATHCDQNDNPKIFKNINKSNKIKRLEKRLAFVNRKLNTAYKKNGSYNHTNGVKKILKRRAKLHYHLANIRTNYNHHITREIVNKLPKAIVLEDLDIIKLSHMHSHSIAKMYKDQKLYQFRHQIEYKAEELNIPVIFADRYYPSSKICSNCGKKNYIKLNDKKYICHDCGLSIDRDINAAINLEKYGILNLMSTNTDISAKI